MSLTLLQTPETEARFRTRADAKGLSVAEYVSRFLETAESADRGYLVIFTTRRVR